MKISNTSIKRNSFKCFYFENEILHGDYDFPMIYSEKKKLCEFQPFNVYKSLKDKSVGVHFFIDDYQFERVWSAPTQYINLLKQAKVVLSPDFSIYIDMPNAVQIYNCYRSRALARFLQKNGVNIVPVVSWSDKSSYAWCFDGIEKGSCVAISSNGCTQNKIARQNFVSGYEEMLKRIKPCQIFFVGKVLEELSQKEKIYEISSFGQMFAKRKVR